MKKNIIIISLLSALINVAAQTDAPTLVDTLNNPAGYCFKLESSTDTTTTFSLWYVAEGAIDHTFPTFIDETSAEPVLIEESIIVDLAKEDFNAFNPIHVLFAAYFNPGKEYLIADTWKKERVGTYWFEKWYPYRETRLTDAYVIGQGKGHVGVVTKTRTRTIPLFGLVIVFGLMLLATSGGDDLEYSIRIEDSFKEVVKDNYPPLLIYSSLFLSSS